jgi:hypothetical protein
MTHLVLRMRIGARLLLLQFYVNYKIAEGSNVNGRDSTLDLAWLVGRLCLVRNSLGGWHRWIILMDFWEAVGKLLWHCHQMARNGECDVRRPMVFKRRDSLMKLSNFFNFGSAEGLIPASSSIASIISSLNTYIHSSLAQRPNNTFAAVIAIVGIAAIFRNSILFTNRSGSASLSRA